MPKTKNGIWLNPKDGQLYVYDNKGWNPISVTPTAALSNNISLVQNDIININLQLSGVKSDINTLPQGKNVTITKTYTDKNKTSIKINVISSFITNGNSVTALTSISGTHLVHIKFQDINKSAYEYSYGLLIVDQGSATIYSFTKADLAIKQDSTLNNSDWYDIPNIFTSIDVSGEISEIKEKVSKKVSAFAFAFDISNTNTATGAAESEEDIITRLNGISNEFPFYVGPNSVQYGKQSLYDTTSNHLPMGIFEYLAPAKLSCFATRGVNDSRFIQILEFIAPGNADGSSFFNVKVVRFAPNKFPSMTADNIKTVYDSDTGYINPSVLEWTPWQKLTFQNEQLNENDNL